MSDSPTSNEQLQRERDAWEHSAAEFCRGMEYYRGLLDRIGVAIGEEAYTADDGSVSDDVLRAKVPEIIERLLKSSAHETSHERATFIELLNLAEHFLAERQPESDERALRKRIADALTQAPAVKTSDDELALMRAKLERLQRWAAKAGHFPECAHWKPWTQKGCTCGLVDLMLSLPVEPT